MDKIETGKFAECAGDLSYVEIACAAVFVSLNNSSIVSFCCFTKISRLEPRLKFKVCNTEIGSARQTFQSGTKLHQFSMEHLGGGGWYFENVKLTFCVKESICVRPQFIN